MAPRGLFHGAHDERGVAKRHAVVGESGRARGEQRRKIGQFLAFQALGNRARLQDVDKRLLRRGPLHILQRFQIVANRRGVRHAHHGGVAACGGRAHAGLDIFLLGLARVAEMDMGIHKAGRHSHALCVEHFDVRARGSPIDVFFHFDNDAVVINQDVAQAVKPGIWIHNMRGVDQQHSAPPFFSFIFYI